MLVEIIGREFDVPTVEAVPAPVRDDVARFETFVGGVAEEPALAAAVDADDGFWDGHGVTVPRSRHTGGMRVVAGTARGRRLVVPDGDHTRPTGDRVRESVFNSLYSLGAVEGARVIDLFAGSGALGIEALSRGAAHCTFVENDRRALAALRDNIETLGFGETAQVVAADGPGFLRNDVQFDLFLLDPPYAFDDWEALLDQVFEADVVIESDREIDIPERWESHRVRRYGSTVVTLATAPQATEKPAT